MATKTCAECSRRYEDDDLARWFRRDTRTKDGFCRMCKSCKSQRHCKEIPDLHVLFNRDEPAVVFAQLDALTGSPGQALEWKVKWAVRQINFYRALLKQRGLKI